MTERRPKLLGKTNIYRDMERLFGLTVDCTAEFPKQVKYSTGEKMQCLAIDCMKSLAGAYLKKDDKEKLAFLTDFSASFEVLRTLFRFALDRRWIKGLGRYALVLQLEESIGKQHSAWKNSILARLDKSVRQTRTEPTPEP